MGKGHVRPKPLQRVHMDDVRLGRLLMFRV